MGGIAEQHLRNSHGSHPKNRATARATMAGDVHAFGGRGSPSY